jgi:sigma-E factor negative regulatory protein RseC
MLCETASVVRQDSHAIFLKTNRHNTCGGCSLKGGCGQYLLERDADCLEVRNADLSSQLLQPQELLAAGEQVQITLEEGQLLRLVVLFYGLPLFGLLLATLLAALGESGEGALVLSALCGLAGGIAFSRLLVRSAGIRHQVSPRITRLTGQGASNVNIQGSLQ